VLRWIVERVEGKAAGELNAFGLTPRYQDLDWSGLDFDAAQYATVSSVDAAAWVDELGLHDELFRQLAHHLPAELLEVRRRLAARFAG
jgi:phosphoenolpyruvate carboxykinase (GTP)